MLSSWRRPWQEKTTASRENIWKEIVFNQECIRVTQPGVYFMAPVGELSFLLNTWRVRLICTTHSNFTILFSFLDPNSKEEENSLDTSPDEAYPLRCGVVRYNPLIQRCCYGRIILKSILCKPPRCGSQFYNPLSQKCCFGRAISKLALCRPKCGRVYYNPLTQKCCFGRPISKYARCLRPKCGRVYYNPQTQRCCYGRILVKYAVCRRG